MDRFRKTLTRHPSQWVLIIILVVATCVRLFGSTQYLPFWEEQVDDMLSIQSVWKNISTGNFSNLSLKGQSGTYRSSYLSSDELNPVYHGVAYYYFLLPSAVISQFNPYGVVVFLIAIGVFTVYLLYVAGVVMFKNASVGLVAAFLGAVSFWFSAYSRWIWTPSTMPFFSLLSWVSFLRVVEGDLRWWYLLIFSMALGSQIHDSGYVPLVFFGLALLIYRPKLPKNIWSRVGLCMLGLIPMIPTFINESTDNFHMARALLRVVYNAIPTLLTMGQAMMRFIKSAIGITIMNLPYIQASFEYLQNSKLLVGLILAGLVFVVFIFSFRRKSPMEKMRSIQWSKFPYQKLVLSWWLVCLPISVFIEYLYADQVLNDYSRMNNLAFALPIFFLCLAYVCVQLWQTRERIWRGVVLAGIVLFVLLNGLIIRDYLWTYTERDWAYADLKKISWLIPHHANGEPYDLVIYRYREGSYENKNVYVMLYFIAIYPARMPERVNDMSTWGITKETLRGDVTHQRMIVVDKRYDGKRELSKSAQRIAETKGYVLYRETF